ncbi:MAG: hypothetical protein ACREHD_30825 [Pirellulales bacterium]
MLGRAVAAGHDPGIQRLLFNKRQQGDEAAEAVLVALVGLTPTAQNRPAVCDLRDGESPLRVLRDEVKSLPHIYKLLRQRRASYTILLLAGAHAQTNQKAVCNAELEPSTHRVSLTH